MIENPYYSIDPLNSNTNPQCVHIPPTMYPFEKKNENKINSQHLIRMTLKSLTYNTQETWDPLKANNLHVHYKCPPWHRLPNVWWCVSGLDPTWRARQRFALVAIYCGNTILEWNSFLWFRSFLTSAFFYLFLYLFYFLFSLILFYFFEMQSSEPREREEVIKNRTTLNIWYDLLNR